MPPPETLDFSNVNSLWAGVLVETLARLGLRQAVLSPGSRSTPLTFALARHPRIEALPLLDERSAAFFALGLARRTHQPVVLLCTSGTAGAHYYPAVIEARESGVPLLVLTADRPPEMRDCRSGQTIDQHGLFGRHVNFFHEFAVPEATLPLLAYARQTVAHAWERAQWPFAGPVHLNLPFRDPLPPTKDRTTAHLRRRDWEAFFAAQTTTAEVAAAAAQPAPERAAPVGLEPGTAGVIIVGPAPVADPAGFCRQVARLSAALGWPVLADPLAPVRHHAHLVPAQATHYDLIARSRLLGRMLRPDTVLCLGGWPTSKALRAWLTDADPEIFLLDARPPNADALHGRTRWLRGSLAALAAPLRPAALEGPWLNLWVDVDRLLGLYLTRRLRRVRGRFEGRVAALLPELLPARTPVLVANSMPVRDLEYFCPAHARAFAVHGNRGANGIDGTLSTALGLAHGGRPTVLLTGDLALLHDANGFLALPHFRGGLTVLLINNAGGGIFGHLPVAEFEPPFEKYFATPQRVDFRQLCGAHRVAHTLVRDWTHLRRLLARLPRRGVRVLEVRTDRRRDAAVRRELFAAVVAEAEQALR